MSYATRWLTYSLQYDMPKPQKLLTTFTTTIANAISIRTVELRSPIPTSMTWRKISG